MPRESNLAMSSANVRVRKYYNVLCFQFVIDF